MSDKAGFESRVIDVEQRKRRKWMIVAVVLLVGILFFGSRLLGIYVDALWFLSVGYSSVYWYKFKLGGLLFIIFLFLTFLPLWLSFRLLGRAFPRLTDRPRIKLTVEDMRDVNLIPFLYRPAVWFLSIGMALMFAGSMSQEWSTFALFVNSTPANLLDPIFQKNVSFYLFTLPVWELISGWLLTVVFVIFAGVGAGAGYSWYFERAHGFAAPGVRRSAIGATSLAGAAFAIALAVSAYINRYDLLYARHNLFSGASYTDANVRLPALNVLVFALLVSGVVLVVNAFVMKRGKLIAWLGGAVALVWLVGYAIIPQAVYSFSVRPNELAKELPYIEHNIKVTRQAFAINRFEERDFNPRPTLTADQIDANRDMLSNIRLWDRAALQSTLGQIQVIRTYYEFESPDVDRYVINGKLRQVMLAAREMDTEGLQQQSKNWINEHLVYTHGYGVTMSSVNEFTTEGLPHLLLKNMPVESEIPEIKITRPEIYFGELTRNHVYVHTKPQGGTQPEFNYPAPDNTDSYNEYEGNAGIPVGGVFRKTALALHLGDGSNLMFSNYISADSRVLMRRQVDERVRHIAPFLLYEGDPYIVIGRDGKLYWIIDAFTVSDRYPFSATYQVNGRGVNYMRNSVKAVVDAYEGEVRFFVFDEEDPVINTYRKVFPGLFRPRNEMPADLLEHVRYPSLFMSVQATVYTKYHMQSPQTFFNQEDLWAVATVEPPAQNQQERPEPMKPYHVLITLPGEEKSALEFVNILPFTPAGPGRNNMIGWMAARSDGDNYGSTLVFSFPKNVTVSGPAQIKARVNQDPELSQKMTLWNQQGSRLIRGSLLVIPIADSLLYLEPFFLRAENSGIPELRLVAVATQETLKGASTFDDALRSLFPQIGSQQVIASATGEQQTTQMREQPAVQRQPGVPEKPAADIEKALIDARQLLLDYQRLTAEGRHREAGEKLDQLKSILNNSLKKGG